jgi:4-hydroxybenzoate polyprenyltransferase
LASRLWVYQRERFPVFKHGALILVFSGGEALYGARLRGPGTEWRPDGWAILVAATVCFGFFLQLRIADEHKDAEDDRLWRPERAVPRGLVTLGELRGVAAAVALVQLGLTVLYAWPLAIVLGLVWGYMALMTVEFFAPAFLRRRPVIYLVSHMVVMPLIALFSVTCGLRRIEAVPGPGVAAFLVLAYCNGAMIEIGRKTWAPQSEREGVETYSKLWGARGAALATGAAALAAAATAIFIQQMTSVAVWLDLPLLAAFAWACHAVRSFIRAPTPPRASAVETAAGFLGLATYLGVAWLPTALRVLAR